MQTFFHLDLKGAPPKPSYLKNFWGILKKWNVSGVLLEWEDCYPYTGDLEFLSNRTYSVADAQQIVQDIRDAHLEVIPLVQTFGHLEFVLKHSSYVAYREVPIYPSSLCPSHPSAVDLITSVLDQVITFHCGIKRFHIGADEVWHMGLCDRCKERLDEGESKEDLFVKHVKAVLENIKMKWPDLELIMWDDMLRAMDESVIAAYNLKPLVEPMVWHYNSAETFCLPPDIWRKYSYFTGVWVAGAFKGASGGSQLVTPTAHHASNTLQWMQILALIKTPLRGFVLTGWSRYDHFAALCETLPCGLPSLGVCLRVISDKSFSAETTAAVESELHFNDLNILAKSKSEEDQMLFSSWQVFIQATKLSGLRLNAQTLLNCEQLQTWLNEWQVANRRVNPMHIVPCISALQNIVDGFNDIEKSIKPHMKLIFFESTVEEWITTYISSLNAKVKDVLQTAERIISEETQITEEMSKKFIEMDM